MGVSERDAWLRAAWRMMVAEGLEAERLIFVDECGAPTPRSRPCMLAWRCKGGEGVLFRCRATEK
jgi:hypothetical protein